MARGWPTPLVLQHGQLDPLPAALALWLGTASGREGVWLELGAGWTAFVAMVGWPTCRPRPLSSPTGFLGEDGPTQRLLKLATRRGMLARDWRTVVIGRTCTLVALARFPMIASFFFGSWLGVLPEED